MKNISIVVFVCFLFSLPSFGFAQHPAELYITSYDNSAQPVCICNGIPQNEIQVSYGIANLFSQTDPNFHVDSIIYICDKSVFLFTQKEDSFTLGGVGLYPGPVYAPTKIGTDTLKIVGFYGPYTSTGIIICHAVASPSIGFYGWTRTALNWGAGFVVNALNPQIRTDTLHDEMGGGFPYHVSQAPQSPGVNPHVEILSCGGNTIDSIYTVGDFSEFEFLNFPTAPVALKDHDSLVISYLFTPQIVGTFPHYLVFHTTEGKYLVWSFEYKVSGNNDVGGTMSSATNALELYPNPASNILKVKIPNASQEHFLLSIINSEGIAVSVLSLGNQKCEWVGESLNVEADVSRLPSGRYNIIYSSDKGILTKGLVIVR